MTWRQNDGPMNVGTLSLLLGCTLLLYSAWLSSIVFCASHGMRPLLIASATFFPVGVVHGIGIWFGGWA